MTLANFSRKKNKGLLTRSQNIWEVWRPWDYMMTTDTVNSWCKTGLVKTPLLLPLGHGYHCLHWHHHWHWTQDVCVRGLCDWASAQFPSLPQNRVTSPIQEGSGQLGKETSAKHGAFWPLNVWISPRLTWLLPLLNALPISRRSEYLVPEWLFLEEGQLDRMKAQGVKLVSGLLLFHF